MSPLALTENNFSKVVVALDSTFEDSDTLFAVRALTTDATVFLTGREIVSYLKRLETKDAQLRIVDYEALKNDAPPAPAAPAAKREKEDARIEGAVQIAIGVKKEVDFSTWYTNVSKSVASSSSH